MLWKKYVPALLLSLILALSGCFLAFADEADEAASGKTTSSEAASEDADTQAGSEGSQVIVTNDIMKIWEQTENDQQSGPDLLAALIGQAAKDPDATGIASAVIGRWENGQTDLPTNEVEDPDAFMAYYLALLAQIQNSEPAASAASSTDTAYVPPIDTTPVTDAEGRELIPQGTFAVTKYCACSICSGGGSGITASGKRPRANHTIAADTRLYPFGTQLMVNGIIYTVEDTGGSVKGKTVDIFVDNHSEAVAYGTHYADVYLVK